MADINPLVPLAADSRSLDALRNQASRDPQAAVRSAAGQFEALFMRQLLKSMRDAIPKSGMWDGAGQAMYQDMFDQQMAQSMSGRPGGLADVIARQLSRNVKGGVKAADVTTTTTTTTTSVTTTTTFASAGGTVAAGAKAEPAVASSAPVAKSAMPDLKNLSAAQADFVRRVWPHALLAERSTGVPASFIVGQAALESGWGRHEIRKADGTGSFNLFGIKASGGWGGAVAAAATTEYVDGAASRRVERFRAYGSYAEAFGDWASLMAKNPRYAKVLQSGTSVQGFASGLQKAGYATDPAYGAKLERTINQTLLLKRLVT